MHTIKLNDDQLFILMTNLVARGSHPLEGQDVQEVIKQIRKQTKKTVTKNKKKGV